MMLPRQTARRAAGRRREQVVVPADRRRAPAGCGRRAEAGLLHVARGRTVPLDVDPLPRVLDGQEWDALAAGLASGPARWRPSCASPQRAVDAGVVPAELVRTSIHRAPEQPRPWCRWASTGRTWCAAPTAASW
jgi:hypothetical protein